MVKLLVSQAGLLWKIGLIVLETLMRVALHRLVLWASNPRNFVAQSQ